MRRNVRGLHGQIHPACFHGPLSMQHSDHVQPSKKYVCSTKLDLGLCKVRSGPTNFFSNPSSGYFGDELRYQLDSLTDHPTTVPPGLTLRDTKWLHFFLGRIALTIYEARINCFFLLRCC